MFGTIPHPGFFALHCNARFAAARKGTAAAAAAAGDYIEPFLPLYPSRPSLVAR